MQPNFSRKEFLKSLTEVQRHEFLQQESQEKVAKELESQRIYNSGYPLIMDLSYCSIMKPSEQNSMINQIRLSIGFLRKQNPQFLKLLCTSVPESLFTTFHQKGSQSWKLDLHQSSFQEVLPDKQFVILSPDAEEVLQELDFESTVYIIGGLVDKTVQAKQTLNKSLELNIRAARFPIKESLAGLANPFKLKKVLNINTVIEILHKRAAGLDWQTALLTSIPARWLIPP